MSNELIKFDIYSYQLSTVTNKQISLFGKNLSLEEVEMNKNRFFKEVLESDLHFISNKHDLNYRIEYADKEFVLLRLSNKRRIVHEKNFKKHIVETEPSSLIAIYNDPEIQFLAIESDLTSFGKSASVLKIIEKEFEKRLNAYYIKFNVKPTYEEKFIWDFILKYTGRVEKMSFEFAKPNLARISNNLPDELKAASKVFNSNKTKLVFEAEKESTLEGLNKDNPKLVGIVDASAAGAGAIKLKLKDLRRWESNKEGMKSIRIGDLELDANNETLLKFIEIFKVSLKDKI